MPADPPVDPPAGPLVIEAARVLRDDGRIAPAALTIEGGIITELTGIPDITGTGMPTPSFPTMLKHGILVPGFIDLQFNGALGIDLAAADHPQWDSVRAALLATGVTAILATFVSAPPDRLRRSLQMARAAFSAQEPGRTRLLGVHLEGPLLAPAWKGAHDATALRTADDPATLQLFSDTGDLLRIVTLAPELPGALEVIERLVAQGTLVSIGHSGATAQQVTRAADRGARMVTHLFNAQTGLHHRKPGIVGATLTDTRYTAGLIADLHHVAAEACLIAFAAKPDGIALVTDSVAAAGLPLGTHQMADGQVVLVEGQPPQRADGTLAGSALRMDEAVRNVVALGVPLATALRAASRVPATLLGRPDLGRIEIGARADLVWLSDDLHPLVTWINGHPTFFG